MASDQLLIERMSQAGGDATFARLAAEIATSKQFRYRRGREETQQAAPAKSKIATSDSGDAGSEFLRGLFSKEGLFNTFKMEIGEK